MQLGRLVYKIPLWQQKCVKSWIFFFVEDYAPDLETIVSNEANKIAKSVTFKFLSIFEHIFIHGNSRSVDITP